MMCQCYPKPKELKYGVFCPKCLKYAVKKSSKTEKKAESKREKETESIKRKTESR